MSIGKRIAEAVEKMAQNDPEGALLPLSSAVDATATKLFSRRGRKSYKDFIHQNLALITKVGFGPSVLNINVKYSHPDLETDQAGLCTIQDVLYHVVRCGLAHAAELPPTLRFVDESRFEIDNDVLSLPGSLVYGLLAAVVVCPANTDQAIADNYGLDVRGFQVPLNRLWGKKTELESLLAAMDAI